jgi:hypothetical protein
MFDVEDYGEDVVDSDDTVEAPYPALVHSWSSRGCETVFASAR